MKLDEQLPNLFEPLVAQSRRNARAVPHHLERRADGGRLNERRHPMLFKVIEHFRQRLVQSQGVEPLTQEPGPLPRLDAAAGGNGPRQ